MRFTLGVSAKFRESCIGIWGPQESIFHFCNRRILSSDSRLQDLWRSRIRNPAGPILAYPTAPFRIQVKDSYNVYGISIDRRPVKLFFRNNVSKYRHKNEETEVLITASGC